MNKKPKVNLEQALALTQGHVYWKDLNLVFLGCNNNLAKFFGLKNREEIVGKTDYDLCLNKEDADRIRATDQSVLDSKQFLEFESSYLCDGGETKYFFCYHAPIFSQEGKVVGVIGTSVDVTEHKKLEAYEKKLFAEEERFRVLSLLANSMAHELRTPFASMLMALGGLKKYFPDLINIAEVMIKEHPERFNINLEQMRLMKKVFNNLTEEVKVSQTIVTMLVNNVSALKPDRDADSDTYGIHSIISEAMNIYRMGLIYPEVKIYWEPKDNIDFIVHASAKIVIQVLINLLKNAGYYIKAAGRGEIRMWVGEDEESHFLYFEDTAKGIKPGDLSKIFDQFFTNTPGGMGLGLAFCKTMMIQIGGNIDCSSEYGKYTRFRLIFPKERLV